MHTSWHKMFLLALVASPAVPLAGVAQMPGVPVLQNAFANAGITGALNIASAGGRSSYGAAAAWAPSSARFQLSVGGGVQIRTGKPARTLYGLRANVPIMSFAGGGFGLGAFGGYGGATGAGSDSSLAKTVAPVGVTVGYRRMVGTRGVSAYAAPHYEFIGRGGNGGSTGVVRVGLGLDVGVTSSIGVTLGVELGQKGGNGSAKPSGTSFGAAASYALGRR